MQSISLQAQSHSLLSWKNIRSWFGIFSRERNFGIYWMGCLVASTAGLDAVRKKNCLYLSETVSRLPVS